MIFELDSLPCHSTHGTVGTETWIFKSNSPVSNWRGTCITRNPEKVSPRIGIRIIHQPPSGSINWDWDRTPIFHALCIMEKIHIRRRNFHGKQAYEYHGQYTWHLIQSTNSWSSEIPGFGRPWALSPTFEWRNSFHPTLYFKLYQY
jgi:hypothetical protein